MFNLQKYICCYEQLEFYTGKNAQNYFEKNIKLLKSTLKLDENKLKTEFSTAEVNNSYYYATILMSSLKELVNGCDLDFDMNKEELLSIKQFNIIVEVVKESVLLGITQYLPEYFVKTFRIEVPQSPENVNDDVKISKLRDSVQRIGQIFVKTKKLSSHAVLQPALLQILFSIYYLETNDRKCAISLKDIFPNRQLFFQNLMLLKGVPGIPINLGLLLHRSLLDQLQQPGGFEVLCGLVLKKSEGNSREPDWRTYDVISKIVAGKGHSKGFYRKMSQQIVGFLKTSIGVEDMERYVPVCVTTLKRLCELNTESETYVGEILTDWMKKLIVPEEILAGTVLLTGSEFFEALQLTSICFGGLPMHRLPSKLIIPYTKLLFHLYCLCENPCQSILSTMLMYLLNNRTDEELKSLTRALIFRSPSYTCDSPFPRLSITSDLECDFAPNLIICAEEAIPHADSGKCFSRFLIDAGNVLLTYNIFVHLLHELVEEMSLGTSDRGDLLSEEEEVGEMLSKKFMKRLTIIEILQSLINCKKLQAHVNENPRKITDFVKQILLENVNPDRSGRSILDTELIMLLLTIFKELLACIRNKEIEAEMLQVIRDFKNSNSDPEIQQHLGIIFTDFDQKKQTKISESKFQEAMLLFNDAQEIHLKVYGIQQFIRLINERNKETLANKHILLALALKNLKIIESYSYLNTIRLLVALTNVMESEVIDALLAEYQNDALETDFRLKIGEVTIKISEALGPIAYRYKRDLINCFLKESQSEKDEIRTSSLANIGMICRILVYQIHGFFQEILFIIHKTIETDKYLPARRSAIMVLSQLLQGMGNVLDFQEYLLPIYRTLKHVLQTETDQVTQIHAALSIETLNKAIKEFLCPEMQPQLYIKVKSVAETSQIDVKYK